MIDSARRSGGWRRPPVSLPTLPSSAGPDHVFNLMVGEAMPDPLHESDCRWHVPPLREPLIDIDPSTPDELGMAYATIAALERQLTQTLRQHQAMKDLLSIALDRLAGLSRR